MVYQSAKKQDTGLFDGRLNALTWRRWFRFDARKSVDGQAQVSNFDKQPVQCCLVGYRTGERGIVRVIKADSQVLEPFRPVGIKLPFDFMGLNGGQNEESTKEHEGITQY